MSKAHSFKNVDGKLEITTTHTKVKTRLKTLAELKFSKQEAEAAKQSMIDFHDSNISWAQEQINQAIGLGVT